MSPTGDLVHNPSICPLVLRSLLNPLSHTSQGEPSIFKRWKKVNVAEVLGVEVSKVFNACKDFGLIQLEAEAIREF